MFFDVGNGLVLQWQNYWQGEEETEKNGSEWTGSWQVVAETLIPFEGWKKLKADEDSLLAILQRRGFSGITEFIAEMKGVITEAMMEDSDDNQDPDDDIDNCSCYVEDLNCDDLIVPDYGCDGDCDDCGDSNCSSYRY